MPNIVISIVPTDGRRRYINIYNDDNVLVPYIYGTGTLRLNTQMRLHWQWRYNYVFDSSNIIYRDYFQYVR